MRDSIGIDALDGAPDDEQLEQSREIVRHLKAGLGQRCEAELEGVTLQAHFPFDDHDENA